MAWSLYVGRLFGSQLRLHATFFLLLLWIGASVFSTGGTGAALASLAFILALFASVLAHECGHILMARLLGVRTPDITLLPIGGMAPLQRVPEQPRREISVALAGPAVNLAIWLLLTYALGAETRLAALENIDDPAQGFWARLAAANLFLVLFNLVPALPMDGGRVLRAALALRIGRARATRIAATAGQVLAFGFGLWGLVIGSPILILIGVFVFVAATSETTAVAMRDIARSLSARDAMITAFETLNPRQNLQAATDSLTRTTQHEFPVLGPEGQVIGFLDRGAIYAAASSEGPDPSVGDIMDRDFPTVPLNTPLDRVLDQLFRSAAPAVAVSDASGRLIGYITRENIGELMVVSGQAGR